ncbi:DUF2461 domain-containing protein [Oricola indica]|uniref:DUF2461 domain-containing protein n=1 Tax=Oricola indica TaxID=2872591 RepID=UPI003CCBE7C8
MSTQEFTGFTDATLDFLSGLKANNNREWFTDHKKSYEAAVKKPTKAFSDLVAAELEQLTGKPHKPKIFRINRDIRFSKDKTPYNTHIHLSWATPGEIPAFMFGVSTEYCTIGCGAFEFPGPALDKWRKTVSGPQGETIGALLDGLVESGFRLSEPALKRVPAGVTPDAPQADLARHKGLAVWHDLEGPAAVTRPDIMARVMEDFERLLPVRNLLAGLSQN